MHEMPGGAVSHHLEDELKAREITDVFCVGTAGDYCVSHTAIDTAQAGFKAYVIEDVTKSFDLGAAWATTKAKMKTAGVSVVKMDSPEVQRLKVSDAGSTGLTGPAMVFNRAFNGPVFFGYSPQ